MTCVYYACTFKIKWNWDEEHTHTTPHTLQFLIAFTLDIALMMMLFGTNYVGERYMHSRVMCVEIIYVISGASQIQCNIKL